MNDLLLKQIENIIDEKLPLISNLSNVSALLNKLVNINWCGFYIVKGNALYLGPFQGEVACTMIPYGKGVCGTSFKEKKTIVANDVNKFEGHIACSSLSKSEIVSPIIKENQVVALIDIDSPIYNRFSNEDRIFLEQVTKLLANLF